MLLPFWVELVRASLPAQLAIVTRLIVGLFLGPSWNGMNGCNCNRRLTGEVRGKQESSSASSTWLPASYCVLEASLASGFAHPARPARSQARS
jgi:hypothetical protein